MTRAEVRAIADIAAAKHGLDPLWLMSIFWLESSWRPDAVNATSWATGLGGVLSHESAAVYGNAFASRPTIAELKVPATNAEWSARILASNMTATGGDLRAAVKRYSGGWTQAGDAAFVAGYWAPFQRKLAELQAQEVGVPPAIAGQVTTWHFQTLPGWAAQAVEAMGAGWAKIMQPSPGADPFPGRKKCIRFWTDDWDRPYIAQGAAGADHYMAQMLPLWRQFSNWGECVFELPNEPAVAGDLELTSLNAFTARCIEIADATPEHFKLVVLNISEGSPSGEGIHPDPADNAKWKTQQLAPCVKVAVAGGHLVGLHGYWRPGVEGPTGSYHAMRFVDMRRWWGEAGVPLGRLRIALTEWGVDGGIAGHPPQKGWRSLVPRDDYATQLVEAEAEFRDLGYVEFAAVFNVGSQPPWGDYEHTLEDCLAIARAMPSLGAPPVEPPIEPPDTGGNVPEYPELKCYTMDGQPTTLAALQAKYKFTIRRAEGVAVGAEVFRLTALREKGGDTALIVRCLLANGQPDVNRAVAGYWPDAPVQNVPGQWYGRYVVGQTNANGEVTALAYGPGGVIHDDGGPHATWVASPTTKSDCVDRLGWLGGTNHDHVDCQFTLVTEAAAVPGAPPAGTPSAEATAIRWNCEEAVREVEAATLQLEKARARLLDNVIANLYKIEGVR